MITTTKIHPAPPMYRPGATLAIMLCEHQPPMDCVYLMNGNGDKACCYAPKMDPDGDYTGPCWVPPNPQVADHLLPAPLAPGDRIGLREEWRYDPTAHHYQNEPIESAKRVMYSDGKAWADVEQLLTPDDPLYPIRPAATMPDWAIRHIATVKAVRCEQVKEMCMLECHAAGVPIAKRVDEDFEVEIVREQFIKMYLAAYPHSDFDTDWVWKIELTKNNGE